MAENVSYEIPGRQTVDVPSVYFNKIHIENDLSGINVDVELNLKIVSTDGVGMIRSKKFRDGFSIKLVQVTNKNFYEQLNSMSDQKIANLIMTDYNNQNSFSDYKVFTITEENAKQMLSGDKVEVDKFKNTRIYNTYFKNGTPFKVQQTDHLSYFVLPCISLTKDSAIYGKPLKQKIIHNGNRVADGVIFRLPKEESIYGNPQSIWGGPVHFNEKHGFMAGAIHLGDPHPVLSIQPVFNSLVNDDSIFSRYEQSITSLIEDKKQLQKSKGSKLLTPDSDDLLKSLKSSYFSKFVSSRGELNNCRFFFGFDFYQAIKDNCMYKSFFMKENLSTSLEMLRWARISSFKLFRRKVKNYVSYNPAALLNPGTENSSMFAKPELIVTTADDTSGVGKLAASEYIVNDPIHEGKFNYIGSIKEVSLNHSMVDARSRSPFVRHFTGVDASVSKKTDGLFEYKIEVEIEDPTVFYLQQSLASLATARDAYASYNSWIKSWKKNLPKEGNRFDENFSRSFNKTQVYARCVSSIKSFLGVMKLYSIGVKPGDFQMFQSLINPVNGGPKNVNRFLSLINKMITFIESEKDAFRAGSIAKNTMSNHRPPTNKAQPKTKTIKVAKVFSQPEEIFDCDTPISTGTHFFTPTTVPSDGLVVLNSSDFSTRIEQEMSKYFKSDLISELEEEVAADINSGKYSFLTPSVVMAGREGKHLSLDPKNPEFYDFISYVEILYDILRYNTSVKGSSINGDGLPFSVDPKSNLSLGWQKARNKVIDFFARKGSCTVDNMRAFTVRSAWEEETREDSLVSLMEDVDVSRSKIQVTKGEKSIKETIEESKAVVTEIEKDPTNPARALMELLGLFIFSNNQSILNFNKYDLNNSISYFTKDQIGSLPNQIKSLTIASTVKDEKEKKQVLNPQTFKLSKKFASFCFLYMNFLNLARVEAFRGYRKKNNRLFMNDPTFSTIDSHLLSKINSSKTLSFCRIKKHTVEQLPKPQLLDFPIYNSEFFMLSDSTTSSPAPEGTQTATPRFIDYNSNWVESVIPGQMKELDLSVPSELIHLGLDEDKLKTSEVVEAPATPAVGTTGTGGGTGTTGGGTTGGGGY